MVAEFAWADSVSGFECSVEAAEVAEAGVEGRRGDGSVGIVRVDEPQSAAFEPSVTDVLTDGLGFGGEQPVQVAGGDSECCGYRRRGQGGIGQALVDVVLDPQRQCPTQRPVELPMLRQWCVEQCEEQVVGEPASWLGRLSSKLIGVAGKVEQGPRGGSGEPGSGLDRLSREALPVPLAERE